jgi:predicted phage terminase large subunit-like protein
MQAAVAMQDVPAQLQTFMAFDFGTQRTGVAVGNRLMRAATPQATIQAAGDQRFTHIGVRLKEWQPDAFMVEKKSNGAPLYQEFRRMGIPVGEFTPGKGQDKIARVNAVSALFQGGVVFAPDRRWAKEVIEECNDFPSGTNDDLVDSTTLSLMRFRQGGFIKLATDEPDPIPLFKSKRGQGYYTV